MSSTDVVAARKALSTVSTGKQVNEDSWMTMWCSVNWGELLQPAPLSIALLGSLLIIASSVDDFSLLDPDNKSDVTVTFVRALFSDSFKTCLAQMVGEGYTAFESAHHDMERIRNASSQIPDLIKNAVNLVVNGSPQEVGAFLTNQIEGVVELANICAEAAKHSETAFKGISDLSQELVLACTHRVGTAEQKLAANEIHLAVLKAQKEQEDQALKDARDTHDTMKKSFVQADKDFHDAVQSVPSGWDLVGMQVVESVTGLLVSAGNAAISAYTLKEQAMQAGLGAFKSATGGTDGKNVQVPGAPSTTAPNGVPTAQANASTLTDPSLLQAQKVLDMVNAEKLLVSGGPGGKPDWAQIRGTNPDAKSGGTFVKATLETLRDRVDPSKPISAQLTTYVATALNIINEILRVGGSAASTDDTALDKTKPEIETLIAGLQGLVTSCNLILKQTGQVGNGPGTPPAPATTSSSASKMAVENAKFKVDQTRANLETSRTSYEKAADRLAESQKEITKTIGEITNLSLVNASLEKMLPVLKKAVGAFTTLRAQFSQLCQLFMSVASLLIDILQPSVGQWAKTMEDTRKIGGVTVGAVTRQLVYAQMMVPLKASMLSEKISGTYLDVSNQYILPAQRKVGQMLQFADDKSPEGMAALQAKLRKAQLEMQASSQTASQKISELVAADQKKFAAAIETRLQAIQTAVKPAIPAIAAPIPASIKEVADAHVEDFEAAKADQDKHNPMYDPVDDMM